LNEIPKKDDEYDFFVCVYADLLTDGVWPVVGNIPFENDADAWGLPTYMKDIFTGKFSIYNRGEITPATEKKCKGMELTAVWDRQHVIDRLMGTTKYIAYGKWKLPFKLGEEIDSSFYNEG